MMLTTFANYAETEKVMSPYEFTSKTHSLSTEDFGKIFID